MKQLKTDVLIIGAGTGGMAAAVSAGEGGARVIAVEKSNRTGGSANMGSGLFAVESRLQRLKHISLTKEEAFKIYMDFTHWRVNAPLVKAFIDRSASTIDWLENMGVEFFDLFPHGIGNYPTQHTVKGQDSAAGRTGPAAAMMKILSKKAEELGVKVLLKSTVKKLLQEGGRVVGAIIDNASGEGIQVKSGAVIIATGGSSAGILHRQSGEPWGGIRLAREEGAATRESNPPTRGTPFHYISFFTTLGIAFWQPGLTVNLAGERFMNEEIVLANIFESNAIQRQKNAVAFAIFDEDTKNHYVETGFDFVPGGLQVPITKAITFEDELKQMLKQGSDVIFVADSLEGLATMTGIEPKGLQQTVKEYNRFCETGRDFGFNKNPRYLRTVKKPKFYAGKRSGEAVIGWNGIRINQRMEVITSDYKVIPGLYAVGMDAACETYYDTYPFIMPATAMGFAINSGRMAGENAAEYTKSLGKR